VNDSKINETYYIVFLNRHWNLYNLLCATAVSFVYVIRLSVILNKKMYYVKYLLLLSFNFSKWILKLMFIFFTPHVSDSEKVDFPFYFFDCCLYEPLAKESLVHSLRSSKNMKTILFKKVY